MIRKSLSLIVTVSAVLGASQLMAAVSDPHQKARQMIAPPAIAAVAGDEAAQRLAVPDFLPPDVRAREMIRGKSAATTSPQGQLQSHTLAGDIHRRAQAMILCKM